jgi:ethanolaminephosphotransferase
MQLCLLSAWQKEISKQTPVPAWLVSAIIAGLSHVSFFMTGHTNSIASVDLSNAYIGVEGYDTILIGALTFFSNWYGGVWWAIAGWLLIMENAELTNVINEKSSLWWKYIVAHSILFSSVLLFLSISVTALREHLFIWTVFSPKYLYQVAWNCLFHWFLQVFVGSLFVNYLFSWNTSSQSDTPEDEDISPSTE